MHKASNRDNIFVSKETKQGDSTMKRKDLSFEERYLYAPWYERLLVGVFAIALLFISSIASIAF